VSHSHCSHAGVRVESIHTRCVHSQAAFTLLAVYGSIPTAAFTDGRHSSQCIIHSAVFTDTFPLPHFRRRELPGGQDGGLSMAARYY
jgi:hypothetical protein